MADAVVGECLRADYYETISLLDILYRMRDSVQSEVECYWYHPDHLGSSSLITDKGGSVVQHLHYLPWGEDFVNQRLNGFDGVRFTFSAKERDSETGLSYFGSRYYSSDLSIWLSVDPMCDKYASLSPYVYCANNPVKLVDPNGEEIGDVDEASRKKIEALTTKGSADYSRAFTRKYNQLAKSKTVYNFKEASQDEITAQRRGGVFHNDDGSVDIIHSEGGVRTSTEGGFSSKYATLFEETFHASEFDKGRLNLNAPTCFDEAKAWKFAVKAPGTSFWDELNNAFTFAGVVDKLSVSQLSYLFHRGGKPQVDEYGRGEHIMGAEKGLYNHLPIK
jgi:RHS repeat-associated protein